MHYFEQQLDPKVVLLQFGRLRVDVLLARRTRALLLGAEDSKTAAPATAKIMAEQLGHDDRWIDEQLKGYMALADGYRISAET